MGHTARSATASVVIPAHDEQQVLPRTLRTLLSGFGPGELEVVVVCNGCTDRTAAAVREEFPQVRVLEVPEPSKAKAVRVGNRAVSGFPRVHLDADVELDATSLRALLDAVGQAGQGGALAAAPERALVRERSSWAVRAYYDVWERLPQVRDGLFGRGVFVLSEEGQARVDALPSVLSDDLAVSDAFGPHERVVVRDARVAIRVPHGTRDLVRRRVRAATGVSQADALGLRRSDSATTPRSLARLAVREPRLAPRLPVFLAVTVAARVAARRAVRAGDFTTWLRDEGSRA